MVNMGERLKALRTEQKLTQKQIANRVGVAISAISSYEASVRYPSYDVLIKLARIYHVTTDFLLGIENRHTLDVTGLDDNEISVIAQIVEIIKNK